MSFKVLQVEHQPVFKTAISCTQATHPTCRRHTCEVTDVKVVPHTHHNKDCNKIVTVVMARI